MKVPWFNPVRRWNWQRLAVASTIACGVWSLWAAVIPQKVHVVGTAILGTCSFVLGYTTRGTKYEEKRQENGGI